MSAADLRYGRKGGHALPARTPAEEQIAFAAAAARGEIVRVRCDCPVRFWWAAKRDVGRCCELCGTDTWAIDERKTA